MLYMFKTFVSLLSGHASYFTDYTNSRCSLEISHYLAMTQFSYHVAHQMFSDMLMLPKCSIEEKLSINLFKRPTNIL